MIKPNMVNPQNFSVEALDRVGDFYKQSFEQLSQFYAESFSQLLWTVGGVGFIAGLAAPAVVWFFNNKILKKDRNEMEQSIKKTREELEGAINKIKEEYEKKLEENLKKFKEDFEDLEEGLKQEIGIAEWKSFVYQGAAQNTHNNFEDAMILYWSSLDAALCKKLDHFYISSSIVYLIETLQASSRVDDFIKESLENQIEQLKNYKKEDRLFQEKVTELEQEFKKALERANNQQK